MMTILQAEIDRILVAWISWKSRWKDRS